MDVFSKKDPFMHLTDVYSYRYEPKEIAWTFGYKVDFLFYQIRGGYNEDPMDNRWDRFDDKCGFDSHDAYLWAIMSEPYNANPQKSSTYMPGVHLAYKHMCIQKAVKGLPNAS